MASGGCGSMSSPPFHPLLSYVPLPAGQKTTEKGNAMRTILNGLAYVKIQ
jgi:hypothetical protein